MAAPKGNSNRLGKTGQQYNLSAPRLVCDKCLAKDVCPLYRPGPTPCAFLKRMKRWTKLDTLSDIRNVRKQVIIDSLTQLTIHSMVAEKTGESGKNDIAFRKLLMEQLKELERDQFNQQIKSQEREEENIFGGLIREIRESKKPALPDPNVIEAEFKEEKADDGRHPLLRKLTE